MDGDGSTPSANRVAPHQDARVSMSPTETETAAAQSAEHESEQEHGGDGGTMGALVAAVERRPGSQVALTIEAPAGDVDAAVAHAIRHLATRFRFPGFRPGKAPAPVIERAVGWPAIAREA